MALTKPKLSQNIDTDISVFSDPILVLHQGSTSANVDVGFLMNRSNGLTANAAVVWQESSKSFVHILTTDSGAPDSNLTVQSYANVSVGNVLLINNAGIYVDGTLGTAGQVLASDGSKTYWAPPGGFTGGIVSGATVFQSNLVISNTTPSTSAVTGALVVLGGAGISGNVYMDAIYTTTGIYWAGNNSAFTSFANADVKIYLESLSNVNIGLGAGLTTQGNLAIAIGKLSGNSQQGVEAVAIGHQSGNISQSDYAIAIGSTGGYGDDYGTGGLNQGLWAVAIGQAAGSRNQGSEAVAIGDSAGFDTQGSNSIAIGLTAGFETQSQNATAIGAGAGYSNQGSDAVAVGSDAAGTAQGSFAVAIGKDAGRNNQSTYAVAIGRDAGKTTQGNNSVSIGYTAGLTTQGQYSVAIGDAAGRSNQGSFAVAIGNGAGFANQANNSIIISANNGILNSTTSGFFVDPVRNLSSSYLLYYNESTKEITYAVAPITYSNVDVAAYLQSPSSIGSVTPNTGAFTNLTVTGNLTVQGNTTTLNTETLTVEDLNITVAGNAGSAAAADGAGLTVAGANARLLYKSATDSWVFDKGVFASGNLVANSGTTSTSTTTGALVVAGGVGISGRLNVAGNVVATSGSTSSSTTTGAIVVIGGIGASGSINAGGSVNASAALSAGTTLTVATTSALAGIVTASSATTSTSITTGAVVLSGVAGGLGLQGNVFAGGNVYVRSRVGYTYSGNATSAVYQQYNAATNSLDTVFG